MAAKQEKRIQQGLKVASIMALIFCIFISLGVCLYSKELMMLFISKNQTNIIQIGMTYLKIEGSFYIGIGCLFLLYGYYRGVGKMKMSLVLTIVSLGTRVLLAYIFAPLWGVEMIWWAIVIGWLLADSLGIVYGIKKERWLKEAFMESMIEFIHERIAKKDYEQGIDFTMGNGHDTLFLSDYCKHVYSYDIQALALNNTKEVIKDKKNVTLFLKSHEYFDEDVQNFDVGVFNLGYLPGGHHECMTHYQTTLKALKKALTLLNPKGCLYIAIYIGHDQGEESYYLEEYFHALDHKLYNVAKFEMMNKNKAPYVVIIEKR